jgi:hypothetical protein
LDVEQSGAWFGANLVTPLVEDRYLKDEPRESSDGRFVA